MSNIKKLFSRFYFKKINNGNLLGEYSNNLSDNINTESADLIDKNNNQEIQKYIGNYYSTWQENEVPCFACLEIKYRVTDKIFYLEWKDQNKIPIFRGEGMLCDDILIGDYQSVK